MKIENCSSQSECQIAQLIASKCTYEDTIAQLELLKTAQGGLSQTDRWFLRLEQEALQEITTQINDNRCVACNAY
ncbi:hypothetical protein HY468_00740 [Candidatus Roizmanbacteria bacterium]|nr:hypothetical protein [Candidatus Roizmanbacteria bacterium]